MLYPWLDWQRSALAAWIETARRSSGILPLDHVLHPRHGLLARTLAAGEVQARPLETVVAGDAPFPVEAEIVAASPFVRLLHLRGPRPQAQRFVVLAPHSGYATAVISPLVTTLLTLGEVVVTDWIDARLAPPAAGEFGLVQQVAIGLEAVAALDGPAHLLALSQSGPAMLAVAAGAPACTSLAFLGCQLDPGTAPTPLQQSLAPWPHRLLAGTLTTAVGPGYPGAGRRVYPSVFQLLAYGMASPQLYGDVQQGLLRELAAGTAGAYDRQHADLHSLLDVPAELFLEMLDWMLGPSPWNGAAPLVAGRRLDLAPLRHVPLLTVEAAQDELVGQGQTHALLRRQDWTRPAQATMAGGRHHDLFTGPGFALGMAPVLRGFYGALEQ